MISNYPYLPQPPKYSPVLSNLTTVPGPNRGRTPSGCPPPVATQMFSGTQIEMFVAKTNKRTARLITATNRVMHLSRSSQPLQKYLYVPSSLLLAMLNKSAVNGCLLPRVRSQNGQVSTKTGSRISSATFYARLIFRRTKEFTSAAPLLI